MSDELVELIVRLARENRRWGCVRNRASFEDLEIPRTKRRRPTLNAFSAIEVLVPYTFTVGPPVATSGAVLTCPEPSLTPPSVDQPASVAGPAQHSRAQRGPSPYCEKQWLTRRDRRKKFGKCGANVVHGALDVPRGADFSPRTSVTWTFFGADDGIRTRDPHLGKKKVMSSADRSRG